MRPGPPPDGNGTLDATEVDRFARIASEWWDPNGKFRPLHKLGPARLSFITDTLTRHFGRPATGLRRLDGLTVLDVGCGGGLVCEPLARLGASVTGLDPSAENIEAARRHAGTHDLAISYRSGRVEDLAAEAATFDAVLCLEVVEHVPDVGQFLTLCARLVRPGGVILVSTINRTLKAYALAIIGAEYILRWLPVGTHQWDRFVTPDELARHLAAAGFAPPALRGLVYEPLADRWSLSTDTDVNYIAAAARPDAPRQETAGAASSSSTGSVKPPSATMAANAPPRTTSSR
jgi:2-polyprenyl-6-hydroxyphenyl methylase/3-demethylubiquinone-9 3-methyltransferase